MNPDRTSEPDRIAYGPENCVDSALKTRCRTDENNKDWIRPQDAVHVMMLELGAPPDNVDVKSVTIYTPQTAVGTFSNFLNVKVLREHTQIVIFGHLKWRKWRN